MEAPALLYCAVVASLLVLRSVLVVLVLFELQKRARVDLVVAPKSLIHGYRRTDRLRYS